MRTRGGFQRHRKRRLCGQEIEQLVAAKLAPEQHRPIPPEVRGYSRTSLPLPYAHRPRLPLSATKPVSKGRRVPLSQGWMAEDARPLHNVLFAFHNMDTGEFHTSMVYVTGR